MTYPRDKFEVLVVSDGPGLPDDATIGRATPGLRLRILRQEHRGPAAARNHGATLATEAHLAFIDDDCVPAPDWLGAFAERLGSDPDLLVGGRTINALPGEACPDATQLLVDFLSAYHNGSAPTRTRFFATSNLAVATAGFRACGGFDGRFAFAGGEDRDFSDRWHTRGGRSALEAKAIVYHSHRLTLPQFLDQHFRYGRGALRFHRAKASRDRSRFRTPLEFYTELVAYPIRRRGFPRGAMRSALLALAQAATAAGYGWEWMTIRD
jgi:GT2 family glycosyltransferase